MDSGRCTLLPDLCVKHQLAVNSKLSSFIVAIYLWPFVGNQVRTNYWNNAGDGTPLEYEQIEAEMVNIVLNTSIAEQTDLLMQRIAL